MYRVSNILMLSMVGLLLLGGFSCGSDDSSASGNNNGTCAVHTDCFTPFEQCDATSQRCVLQFLPCDDQGNCLPSFECREVSYEFPLCMPVSNGSTDGDEEDDSDVESCPSGTVLNGEGNCVTVECYNNDECDDNRICNRDTYKCEEQVCDPACSDEQECVDGSCVIKECYSDSDCSPDKECAVNNEGRRICTQIVCYRDEVCRSDYVCEDRQCIAPCTDSEGDNPCTEGDLCQEGHCIVPVPECTVDLECPEQQICNEYFLCEIGAACTLDAECGDGRRCGRNDVCVHEGCYDDDDCTDDIGMLCDPSDRQCKYKTPPVRPAPTRTSASTRISAGKRSALESATFTWVTINARSRHHLRVQSRRPGGRAPEAHLYRPHRRIGAFGILHRRNLRTKSRLRSSEHDLRIRL